MVDPAHTALYVEGTDYKVLELGLLGTQEAVDFILPDATDGLDALRASLTPASLSTMLGGLAYNQVDVHLPKFKLQTAVELSAALGAMGVVTAFQSPPTPDFTGIDGQYDLYLQFVQHGATLDVKEAGISATGVTVVVGGSTGSTGGSGGTAPPTFYADHPFLVLIRDLPTGSILFVAQVIDPAVP
jgi:serpin B